MSGFHEDNFVSFIRFSFADKYDVIVAMQHFCDQKYFFPFQTDFLKYYQIKIISIYLRISFYSRENKNVQFLED